MAFTVRIELHGADYDDYNQLHDAMEGLGFRRTLKGSDGVNYQLPTAEYDYPRESTGDKVRELASQAAKCTRRTFGILVTEAGSRWWAGLSKQERKNQIGSTY